jgi:hypothetical protein
MKTIDKHTKMLTRTFTPDGTELVSFDVVVQDIFETKNGINKLFKEERNKTIDEILGVLNEMKYPKGSIWNDARNEAIESIKLLREK